MRAALALARRGLGRTWPNPSVGCVLVRDGAVVGRGWTQPGGRPHAEAEALARAGEAAKGAVAYVSLEPCAHERRGPPCAPALAAAGIARAVIACADPDPRTPGAGMRVLQDRGVTVTTGVAEEETRALNAGFFLRVREGRPLVTLKLATSIDGRIATAAGESRWITGEAARERAHGLRAVHDAVAVGSGTVLADDPELTCRLPGMTAWNPVRVIFDGRLRTPLTAKLAVTAREAPVWLVTTAGADGERRRAFERLGLEVLEVEAGVAGSPDAGAALRALAARGITRLLAEGGRRLSAALLRAGLVDRLAWFRAPVVLGGDGVPAAEALGVQALGDAPRFRRVRVETVGEDVLEMYESGPHASTSSA